MTFLLALIALAAPGAFAQTAQPADPAPAAAPTAEQAKGGADDGFAQILRDALKPRLPTLEEARKARLKRDLESSRRFAGDKNPAEAPSFSFNQSNDPEKREMPVPRFLTESLDLNVARPSRRLTLGVGYENRDEVLRGRAVSHDVQRYGFLKLELGRRRDEASAPRKLELPDATYTETETSPKMRVAKDDWSWGSFKREVQDAAR